MNRRPLYILFARQPASGKVKKRLAADLGPRKAANLYRAFLRDALDALGRCGSPFAVGYTPESSPGCFRDLAPEAVEIFPQEGDDLGERMAAAFTRFFRRGWGPIVLAGSDIPLLSPEILGRALEALRRVPAVLGPAGDGGYYLVGLDRERGELFRGIGWGGPSVLGDTVRNLERTGLGYRLLEVLDDIDTAADLERMKQRLGTGSGFPRFTRRALSSLSEEKPAVEPGSRRRAEAGRK